MYEQARFQSQKPSCLHEFTAGDHQALKACIRDRGFAVVKQVISPETVEKLKRELLTLALAKKKIKTGQSIHIWDYIEKAPELWELYRQPTYLSLYRSLLECEDLTINRSMGLIRAPAAPSLPWHSDFSFNRGKPENRDDVLQRGDWVNGTWLYLTGSNPHHGGLAVLEGSHLPDWKAPAGFSFSRDRRCICADKTPDTPYDGMDVPGMVALYAEPGDMIVYAARTYHTNFPNLSKRPRLSVISICRPTHAPFRAPWPLSQQARDFIEHAPPFLKPFVRHYRGISPTYAL